MSVDDIDFFRGGAVIKDPYPYYEQLRAQCPVHREPHQGVYMVTGYDEALAVYHDTEAFSSATSVTGPFPGFPVPLEGDDVTALIEQYRDQLPFSDQLPTFDPPKHTAHRGLLLRLLSPKRLKENEDAMWRLADQQIDEFVAVGVCDIVNEFAAPFAMLVIAELLGVPDEDVADFRTQLIRTKGLGQGDSETMAHTPLEFLYDKFAGYVEERRAQPRHDVLTHMAQATFPDGSMPEVIDVVRVAANLFAAGQETTVRMLGSAFHLIAEDAALQASLRADSSRIPNFVEEVLRYESPIKGDFRLARVPTTIGEVAVPAGCTVMVLNGAANRDPRKFADPATFDPERANAREHVAFGHGVHFCPGAPLARAEGRIAVERMLARTKDIRLSDEHHGPAGARKFRYVPTYMLRGVQELHVEFDL
ncbi:MAG TPA: cytochrome P450 [Acidimicrobiales bacterium]|nr:cytochrome P450 [Acidimicrobiales bacterium]